MTVVEKQDFTCHVCGERYACNVVVSSNSFMATPMLPPAACPLCGTAGRHRVGFSPGTLFDILFELAGNEGIPRSAIERLIAWSTSVEDIEQWRAGFAKTRWERIIRGNLKGVEETRRRMLAEIKSAEPYGDFHILQHDAQSIDEPSEAIRRFASIRLPEFESWPQMNRELRAMMDADPQIELDAAEVIEKKWGSHAAHYRHLDEELKKDLPAKVAAYFEQARQEFMDRVRIARQRLSL